MTGEIPPIVAVDSMTLVWGIREEGPDEDCRRAKSLLRQFTASETQVIIPAVVLAEFLTPVSPADHAAVIESLNSRFILQPFDHDCASLAAHLFDIGKPMRPSGVAGGRPILRADTMIIATAIIYGAGRLYTNDNNCQALANAYRPGLAADIPPLEVGLFGAMED